ncbi:nicotinamidase-like [Diprion similis]|uniref:nicotinamidase-like n=1 Tax=Diprion similis TaxID=362088 RepID=UPI001EF8EC8D|nr:nicotinamidase-like [Diprion similis]XP_046747234.1 nicotinamidase-like [Diprion similis]
MALDKKTWDSSDALLAKFDANHDGLIDYDEFRSMCVELFGPDEVERHEYRVRDIFDILDLDEDGYLNREEWERCYNEWTLVVVNPVNVLIVVDVQNDFIDGSLALRHCGKGQDGIEVIEPINRLLAEVKWNKVVYSLDWHPETHIGFYENLGLRELHSDSKISKEEAKLFDTVVFRDPYLEQRLWPKHCVIDSWGAQLHKDLVIAPGSGKVRKGQHPDMEAYSVFSDNNCADSRELLNILEEVGATDLYVCGLAYDVCVKATCLDGLRLGYRLAVVEDCCRGVNPVDVEETRRLIEEGGGLLTDSQAVPRFVNGDTRSLVMALQLAKSMAKKNGTAVARAE